MAFATLLLSLVLLFSVESRPIKLWKLNDKNFQKARDQSPILILFSKANSTNSTLLLEGMKEALPRMEQFGINAAEINCTLYPKLCKNHGVKHPPLLRFYPFDNLIFLFSYYFYFIFISFYLTFKFAFP